MNNSKIAIALVMLTLLLSPTTSIANDAVTATTTKQPQTEQQNKSITGYKKSLKKQTKYTNPSVDKNENDKLTIQDILTLAVAILTIGFTTVLTIAVPYFLKQLGYVKTKIAEQEKAIQQMQQKLAKIPSGDILWYVERVRQEFWWQHLNKLTDKNEPINAGQLQHMISQLDKDYGALSEVLNIGNLPAIFTGLNTLSKREIQPPLILVTLLRLLNQEGMFDEAQHLHIVKEIAARLDLSFDD